MSTLIMAIGFINMITTNAIFMSSDTSCLCLMSWMLYSTIEPISINNPIIKHATTAINLAFIHYINRLNEKIFVQ